MKKLFAFVEATVTGEEMNVVCFIFKSNFFQSFRIHRVFVRNLFFLNRLIVLLFDRFIFVSFLWFVELLH